jgi:hypothetical protein
MPCYDGQDAENRIHDQKLKNALTALLCGVMRGDARAIAAADQWHVLHCEIDQRRSKVDYDWRDAEIGKLRGHADNVLLSFFEQQS